MNIATRIAGIPLIAVSIVLFLGLDFPSIVASAISPPVAVISMAWLLVFPAVGFWALLVGRFDTPAWRRIGGAWLAVQLLAIAIQLKGLA